MCRVSRGRSARRYTGRSRHPPEAMLTPGQIVEGGKSRHGASPFRGGHHRRVANRDKKLALPAHSHAEPVGQDEEAEPIRPPGPCSARAARASGREEHNVELAALKAVHGSDADPWQPAVGVKPRNRRVEAEGIVTVPDSKSRPGHGLPYRGDLARVERDDTEGEIRRCLQPAAQLGYDHLGLDRTADAGSGLALRAPGPGDIDPPAGSPAIRGKVVREGRSVWVVIGQGLTEGGIELLADEGP